ncbi:hypothetical protein BpHYR1_046655 [Brachionus plicatilis]|uniref:Uncharacterized protein n=1 Tax=Brachionus plicatilis TaxID=10195 RepID=A0A3M7RVK3_BRAPC|nr:hypothetical protein BpHYR1_046655 [Brachionus plicatilis]
MDQIHDRNFENNHSHHSMNNAEVKKKEMFNLIDNISKPNMAIQEFSIQNNQTPVQANYTNKQPLDRGENYWNDWFGRPGAGAPSWTTYKQNLDKMLEPTSKDSFYHNQPNVSGIYALNNKSPRKPKSNHYNNYELV